MLVSSCEDAAFTEGPDAIKNFTRHLLKREFAATLAFLRCIKKIHWAPPAVWSCELADSVHRYLLKAEPDTEWWGLWRAANPPVPRQDEMPMALLQLNVKTDETGYAIDSDTESDGGPGG